MSLIDSESVDKERNSVSFKAVCGESGSADAEAVSYTHLDVYKRQHII